MGKLERIGLVSFKATSSEEIRSWGRGGGSEKTLSILGRTWSFSGQMLVPSFPALDFRTVTGLRTNLTAQIKEGSREVQGVRSGCLVLFNKPL